MKAHFEAEPATRYGLAQISRSIGLAQGRAHGLSDLRYSQRRKMYAVRFDGVGGDDHALDQLVGIALHQDAVLESARLHLVRIRQ